MTGKIGLIIGCMTASLFASAQTKPIIKQGNWHAEICRVDGHKIPFEFEIKEDHGKLFAYILNGSERLKTEEITFSNDSAIINMPVFESYFKAAVSNSGHLTGSWIQGGTEHDIVIPFDATAGGNRFPLSSDLKPSPIDGKWNIEFTRANQTKRRAIGAFVQKGNRLTGSVLTPAGDYRFMEGVVSGDSMKLSTFDGGHAVLLMAKINSDHLQGAFYSGGTNVETWTAVKDANVVLEPAVTTVKDGSDGILDFTFKDLDGKPVSLKSERFKNKVVILQFMGSWCPNCMDETAFLSEYYLKNKDRGVEIIALAYEISTDEERSKKSLQKFQTKFNVQYTMLNTGVTASDPQRTEKTFPQLSGIKVFPTTVILDRQGKVRDISTTFYGPGAGEYYQKYKAHFEESVNAALEQKL